MSFVNPLIVRATLIEASVKWACQHCGKIFTGKGDYVVTIEAIKDAGSIQCVLSIEVECCNHKLQVPETFKIREDGERRRDSLIKQIKENQSRLDGIFAILLHSYQS